MELMPDRDQDDRSSKDASKLEAPSPRCNTNVWILHIGIFILSSFLAIESQVTLTFNPYITSDLHSHSKLSTVLIIVSIVASISKSPIAKLCDVFFKVGVLAGCIFAFILGEICVATSGNVVAYIASQVLYALGSSGTPVVMQIIIADASTLRNRVILSILPMTPFLFSAYIGPLIGEKLLTGIGWRWGLGLFAILVPLFALPLVGALYREWRLRKAKIYDEDTNQADDLAVKSESTALQLSVSNERRRSSVSSSSSSGSRRRRQVWLRRLQRNFHYYFMQLDLIGIILMITSIPCLLVPATLTSGKSADWESPKIYAPMILGGILTLVLLVYEYKWAHNPVLPLRLVASNRVVAAGCLAATLYFMAYCIFEVYVTSFYQVARFASPAKAGYVNNIYDWVSTVAGIVAGLIIKFKRRVRFFLLVGALCQFLGYLCLSICFAKDASLTWIGLSLSILSLGGGFFMWPAQLSVQSESLPEDLGSVTGLYLTGTTIGYSVGSSIAGALWSHFLASNLQKSGFNDAQIKNITGNIHNAIGAAPNSIQRNNINQAYTKTMRVLVFVSLGVAIVASCVSLLVKCDKIDHEDRLERQRSRDRLEAKLFAESDPHGIYDELDDESDPQRIAGRAHLNQDIELKETDRTLGKDSSVHIMQGP